MDAFWSFFSFTDINVRYVALGSVLLAASSAVVGVFTFLRKRALAGDAVAHAVLPGVCLAFILSDSKNPVWLLLGAFITGWLSLVIIDYISSKTRIKEDTSIGLVLSVFFGFGILLLTSIQHSGNASQSGLDRFLFGKAASLVGADLVAFGVVAVMLLLAVIVFYKEFKLLSFDEAFASTIGLPVKWLRLVLTSLTVMAVVVGIQAVGVVLMAAMLITPAAAARYWTDRLTIMLLLSALFGAFSGLAGAFISYTAPAMPTGPWIVMVLSFIAFFSFLLAPGRGLIARYLRQKNNRNRILEENLLKALYHLGEAKEDYLATRTFAQIQAQRGLPTRQIKTGLKRLLRHGYLERKNNNYILTREGKEQGKRVVRLHRLWELYLTNYLRLPSDHVHAGAETMEHIITPELEQKLQALLNYPEVDPHNEQIPYK